MSLNAYQLLLSVSSFYILMITMIMVIIKTKGTMSESTNNIFDGQFRTYSKVAKDDDGVSLCAAKTVRYGPIGCMHTCFQGLWCASVYAERNVMGTGSDDWQCYLCSLVWDVAALEKGNGTYAVAKYTLRGFNLNIPPLRYAEPEGFKMMHGRVTGHYQCTGMYSGNTVTLIYDTANQQWPVLDAGCRDTLCVKPFTRNKVLTSHLNADGWYYMEEICQQSEVSYPYTMCQNGIWKHKFLKPYTCLPATCYVMYNVNPLYKGTIDLSETGRTCKRWDEADIVDSRFWEDEYNATVAQNYCRDPTRKRYLWCNLEVGGWERCSQIPGCE